MTATALPDLLPMSAALVALRDDGTWLAIEAYPARQTYWCVACRRPILANHDSLYLHDEHVRHPINMLFNDEDLPQ